MPKADDEKYNQQGKSGTWVYDTTGLLVSVNGEAVPKNVKVYHPDFKAPKPEKKKEGEV